MATDESVRILQKSRSCIVGVVPDDAGPGVPHGGHLQAGLGEAGTQGR